MITDKKKTVAIVGTAGALIATAMLLDRGPAEGKTARTADPIANPDKPDKPMTAGCDDKAPARGEQDFGRGKLSAALSAGKILRGTGGEVFAAFDLSTAQAALADRPPLNLALVIDRSGSMEGDKLQSAKDAALRFIDRLGERDRIALVQYDDAAQVVVPSIAVDREGKARLSRAVADLRVGGATNLHDGMTLGRDEVQRTFQSGQVSRIILLSDGKANTGVVDQGQISDVARAAADRGVRITTVGVGLDYNEDLMELIAEAGRGNYYYVRDAVALDKVLSGELASIQGTVATNVELRIDTSCAGVEIAEVLGYESRRDGTTLVVPMADLFGGDSRKLLLHVKVPDRQNGRLGVLAGELAFRDAKSGEAKRARIALALEVTDDHAAAQSSVDKDVMAQVLKAQAAQSMRQAAQAYEKGDRDGAVQILRATEAKVEADSGRYQLAPAAVAPTLGDLRGNANDVLENEFGSEGAKDALKKNKARAREMTKGK